MSIRHIIIYKTNGELWGLGNNNNNQINEYKESYYEKPTFILKDTEIKNIICGPTCTLIYKFNGDLLILGLNHYQDRDGTLRLLLNDKEIKYIRCGRFHILLYKYNGDLVGYGQNIFSEFGISGEWMKPHEPCIRFNDKDIKNIYCGHNYSIIYKNNGDLYGLGEIFDDLPCGHANVLQTHTDYDSITKIFLLNNIDIKDIICIWDTIIIYCINGDVFKLIKETENNKFCYKQKILFNDNKIRNIDTPYYNLSMLIIYRLNNEILYYNLNTNEGPKSICEYINNEYITNIKRYSPDGFTLYEKNGYIYHTCIASRDYIFRGHKIFDENVISINENKIIPLKFDPKNINYYPQHIKKYIYIFLIICNKIKYYNIIVPKYMKYLICDFLIN